MATGGERGEHSLSYLVTVSRAHLVPALMLLRTLRHRTSCEVVAVGNLTAEEADLITACGARYLDERAVDLSGRMPEVEWTEKYREVGWYRQMMIRLSIDRFTTTEQVVILDSEVFVFDDWDESRFYDEHGAPKCFFWVPEVRKPDWDYRMYRGAAYLDQGMDGCDGVMEYASSDRFRRHISGVVLFSRRNVAHLWDRLGRETDLAANLDRLFNHEDELAFDDHDFYGIAVDLGLFDDVVRTVLVPELLGWYDNHDDPAFNGFSDSAMWSMCQRYPEYPRPTDYLGYMEATAHSLGRRLPDVPYWNPDDRPLVLEPADGGRRPTDYFDKYRNQLDHTDHVRFSTMKGALDLLQAVKPTGATLVEIGTLRDAAVGGGHSTFKFGEYCSRTSSTLHSVDVSMDAIRYSRAAAADYLPWIRHHHADSTAFLEAFSETVDLLYLDGFDATPGQEHAAAEKQLTEIAAALPRLSGRCVVLLDDAGLPHEGKTRLSARYLAEHGFELVESGYQLLYVRGGRPGVLPWLGRLPARAGRAARHPVRTVRNRIAAKG